MGTPLALLDGLASRRYYAEGDNLSEGLRGKMVLRKRPRRIGIVPPEAVGLRGCRQREYWNGTGATMPVEVACLCGKRLRVQDDYAGRRGGVPERPPPEQRAVDRGPVASAAPGRE